MATYPFPYPSVATYPPPIFPGGYYPSPFPYSHGAPYAATQPYPHPAAVYAPPHGLSPAPTREQPQPLSCHTPVLPSPPSAPPPPLLHPVVLGLRSGLRAPELAPRRAQQPPPAPSARTSVQLAIPRASRAAALLRPPCSSGPAASSPPPPSAPPESTSPPTPAPPTTGAPANSATLTTAPLRRPHQVPGAPLNTDLCSLTPRLLDAISSTASTGTATTPSALISPACNNTVANRVQQAAEDTMLGQTSTRTPTDERAQAKESINHRLQGEFINLQTRLDQQRARERTSFDTIQGHLENLKSMVSQLANSLDKQSTHASKPEPQHFLTVPVAGLVAPQVLGEMPQRYGLQNLSRQNIFLSDDSEHSYYARPEKYNLEQAASEPVFDVYAGEQDGSSTDFVDVLASLQEQHTHEDQQTYESIEYNHSNNEIELPSVTNSELCTELGKAQVHNHEWNMLLTEKREEWDPGIRKTLMDISQVAKLSSFTLVSSPLSMLWDPGASLPLISIKARQLDQTLQTSIHASTLVDKLHGQENVAPLAGSSVTGFNRYTCLSFWVQYKFYVLWKSEIVMTTCISWDPGIQHYMAPNGIISVHQDNSFIMLRAAHFSECKYPCSLYCKCMLKTEYCPSRCLSEISVSCLKRLQWNPGDFTHMLLVLCVSCREITDNCFADLKLMAKTSSKLAALTWHSSLSGTPFLLLSSTTYAWEPGVQCIIDRLLDKFIESNQVQSVQQIRYHAASVWDPGTMLPWYKITVRVNSEHNPFSTAKFNGGKAAYSSKIPTSCLSASFKEEKEMGQMIPGQGRFWFHAMHYCQIFQKCNAMTSQFYWNQDIKFNGIALWMITFNPP